MATGFSTIEFGIMTDGTLPVPMRDDATGQFHYSATVKLSSRADMLALQDLKSVITELPGIGALDIGTIVVEKGPGLRTLTYQEGDTEHEVSAILISISPTSQMISPGMYMVDCTWWTRKPT